MCIIVTIYSLQPESPSKKTTLESTGIYKLVIAKKYETLYQVVDLFLVLSSHGCGASHRHEVLSGRATRQVSTVARRVERGVTVFTSEGNHRLQKNAVRG